MTIDEAREHVGDGVVYLPSMQDGVITSVNDHWAFVRYGSTGTSQATDPALLALLADELARQADDEAWGGRGPSASYAEWLAEGREAGGDD